MARRSKPALDLTNLRLRGDSFQLRFKLPDHLGNQRIEISLKTKDFAQAVTMRDRLIALVNTNVTSLDALRTIVAQVVKSDDALKGTLARIQEEMGGGIAVGICISEAANRFIENRRVFKMRTGHTLYDYGRTIYAFRFIIGDIPVSQITKHHVRQFRDKIVTVGRYWNRDEKMDLRPVEEAARLSTKTVHKMVKNLSTFLNWCSNEDLIGKNPALGIDLPTIRRNATQPPPPELADALCSLPPLERAASVGILEWEVLPWFYRFTGARCGEIAQLRVMDVVTIDGILCLSVFIEKANLRSTKNQTDLRRLVPVHPRLQPHLNRVLLERQADGPEALLFPRAGTYYVKSIDEKRWGYGWSNHYNDHAKKVWPKMHVHAWRSYVITELGRRSIPEEVRRHLVGHVPRDVHASYNHVDLRRLKEAVYAIP